MQADRDAQPNRGFRPNNDKTGQSDAERGGQHNPNRPVNPGNAVNNSGNLPVTNTHERIYTDRPANNRPTTPANTSNAPVGNPQPDANRDVQRNSGRPVNPGNAVNNSGNPPSTGTHERVYTDRPSNTAPVAPANSPNAPVVNPQADANRDVPRNSGRPVNPGNAVNNSGNPPSTGAHERVYTDRPSNTAPVTNPQVEPRNQQPPQNLRADRPGAIRQDTPPSNSNNSNNVTPRVEPKPQPAPQNVHPPQNQERVRSEQPKPQPKQQEEKKKDQKPAKPAKEDKPSKSSK
jgi:hypothetical protein